MAEGSFRTATGFTENGKVLYRFGFLRHFRETVQLCGRTVFFETDHFLKNMQSFSVLLNTQQLLN